MTNMKMPDAANKGVTGAFLLKRKDMELSRAALPQAGTSGYDRARYQHLDGKNVRVNLTVVPVGQKSPLHDSSAEHFLFQVTGSIEFVIDGKSFVLTPGDIIFIPPAVPYEYRNVGNIDAEIFNVLGRVDEWPATGKYY